MGEDEGELQEQLNCWNAVMKDKGLCNTIDKSEVMTFGKEFKFVSGYNSR